MPIVLQTRRIDSQLTIHLFRATGERKRSPDDITEPLTRSGITARIRPKNPIDSGIWQILIDVAQNHSIGALLAVLVCSVLRQWLKEKMGRKIVIEKRDLKISVSNSKELDDAFKALGNYEALRLTINNKATPLTTTSHAQGRTKRTIRPPGRKPSGPHRK